MFYQQFSNNGSNKMDMLLEHFLIDETDLKSKRELRNLNEAEKKEISKAMVDSLTAFTLNKMKNNDYELITASQGDITKFEGYKNMKESLVLLKTLLLNTNGNHTIKELATLETTIRNLENQKPYFVSAYKTDKKIVITLYENIVTALICSISFLISTTIDYVKDMTGNVQLTAKSIRTERDYPTLFLKNLELYNQKSVSGEINKFFEVALKQKNLSGVTTFAVIVAVASIVPIMREIVYQYYYIRINIADYLATQAHFLELNQKNLKKGSDSAKKQQDIANKLLSMSEKIDVDQKASSRRAQNDVIKENSKMSLGSPNIEQQQMDFLL